MTDPPADPLVERVIARMRSRSDRGMVEYGISLEDDVSGRDWITETQEELGDAMIYLEKLRSEIDGLRRRLSSYLTNEGKT